MDIEELDTLLRENGHRATLPRRLVWSVLQGSSRHLTPEEIDAEVKKLDPSVNLSSIYRTLALFAELDLARETTFDSDGPGRWEVAHPDDHIHLVCERCGSIDHHVGEDVAVIRRHLRDGHAFEARQIDLTVSGLCASCAGAQPD